MHFKVMPALSESDIKRFWSHVNKEGPIPNHAPELGHCWQWTGKLNNRNGYGYFGVAIAPCKSSMCRIHRVAWTIFNSDPLDKLVCHRCDNTGCVNPAHLFLGSNSDNVQDCLKKGRHNPPRGERCATHKLKESDVLDIRALLLIGRRHAEIAAAYGVSQSLISVINTRKRWAHL